MVWQNLNYRNYWIGQDSQKEHDEKGYLTKIFGLVQIVGEI